MQVSLEKVLLLINISVFMDVSESALCDFINCCEELAFHKGQFILTKGQTNRHLYIIITGSVQISDEKEILYEIGAQELFGQLTAFSPSVLEKNAISQEDTIVLRISSDNLYEMMSLHPSIAKGMIKTLANKLKVLDNKSI